MSTLDGVVKSVTGTAQSALASITGNSADQVCFPIALAISIFHILIFCQAHADANKAKGDANKDLSNTSVSLPGGTATADGGVAAKDERRQEGAYNENMGALKEGLGGIVGATGLQKEGRQQHDEGTGKKAEGQLSDLGSGVKDRVTGVVGGAGAALTGDKEKQAEEDQKRADGKAKQRSVEDEAAKQ